MKDLQNRSSILMQIPCEPRLLDMRIVGFFSLQLGLALLNGFFHYTSSPNWSYYEFALRILEVLNLVGYVLLIPLAYFIFNLFTKPLTVTLFKEGIEFKYLLSRRTKYPYTFVREIAKEEQIEHLTLTLSNGKRITICVGTLPLEIIEEFVAELQKQNVLLKYCTFDTAENN